MNGAGTYPNDHWAKGRKTQCTGCSHTHTQGHFGVSNDPNVHDFGFIQF